MSTGDYFNRHNSSFYMKINGCIHTLTVIEECRDIGLGTKMHSEAASTGTSLAGEVRYLRCLVWNNNKSLRTSDLFFELLN